MAGLADPCRFIVLLSGGLDSVVNLFLAHRDGVVSRALTFDYGQRAIKKEIEAAVYFCEKLNIRHEVIKIRWLGAITSTALVARNEKLPELKNLDDMNEANASAKSVWVPNRNGVFLNIAAAYAESLKCDYIVPGFNKEEAATFPDNSQSFIDASNNAFGLSTMSGVEVKCFTADFDKKQMMAMAFELGIERERLWSCYEGGSKPCGHCESCQRSQRGFDGQGYESRGSL